MTFNADDLLACYRAGVFPMGEAREDPRVFLVEPEQRGVIPLDGFHVGRRLARTVRRERFAVRVDTAFDATVALCAEAAADRDETWINAPIRRLYGALHARGCAHSVECWRGEALVGGLYGVRIGGAFFGESMVSRATDASKVALVHLVARLRYGGFTLLDAQFLTGHLAQFGAEELGRDAYRQRLRRALAAVDADFYAWPAAAGGAEAVLQATTDRS